MEDRPSWIWLRQAPQGIHARQPATPRLGVLSSPFNPPTRAHRALAEVALAQLDLHEVVCVLPAHLPHKPELELPVTVRADLLRRALEDHPRLGAALCSGALLLEIYEALAPVYPSGTRVYFLLGSDAAERILIAWPYPDRAAALAEMFSRFEVAVADRDKKFDPSCDPLLQAYAHRIHRLQLDPQLARISSTAVRERLKRGEPAHDALPAAVAAAIGTLGLYRGPAAGPAPHVPAEPPRDSN
jgi:nicotinate-nucleotide adenylyltransferase